MLAAGLPTRAQGEHGKRGYVWHCSARVAATDRVLGDEEWAGIARELLDGAGIAEQGDSGGPRWVAIRHADDHIHIAVVLVRQDTGRRFWPHHQDRRIPVRFDHGQIRFLGVWDTVKFVGWLNWKAQLEQAQWPFTRQAPNVARVRHAIAIDEWRTPYCEYRFTPSPGRGADHFREVWFAGVHSDVGGVLGLNRSSDIALKWMVDEAIEEVCASTRRPTANCSTPTSAPRCRPTTPRA